MAVFETQRWTISGAGRLLDAPVAIEGAKGTASRVTSRRRVVVAVADKGLLDHRGNRFKATI
jgi:hypothetical protein